MTEALNHRRGNDAKRGAYEVWYLTWNHAPTGQGFWLRFITEAPDQGDARAELWFARFDPKDPRRTFGVHRRFSSSTFAAATDPFAITIAQSRLGHDHTFGALEGDGHSVEWDLRWTAAAHELRLLPDLAYTAKIGETTVVSPNPRVAMSGRVVIDGEELSFDRAVLGQTHLWGTKHAYAWTWGRCAELAGAPDALLEILAVRMRRRGRVLPPLVMVVLDLDGERHHLNQFRHVAMNRATWASGRVTLAARSALTKVEVELTCAPDRMINAPYLDPDGTRVYCANTEIGDAHIVVSKRSGLGWRVHRTLEGHGTAHFELGGRERDPAVEHEHVTVG